MADNFPDLSSKLGVPSKKSVFERQKAEAEAKKAREKAETAAVYEDFVKSFDDDGEPKGERHVPSRSMGLSGLMAGGVVGGPGKRHFTSSGLKSGPGSLGAAPSTPRNGPGSLGSSQSSYGKKRPYEDFKPSRRDRNSGHGMFSYEDDWRTPPSTAFRTDDEEDQKDSIDSKAAAKPTLHLSSLPPGTSPAVVKALFTPSPLLVEKVMILPTSSLKNPERGNGERKSASAIVTLASETPATDIDTMVSHLQNKYLGFGFNLSISRHLSSAALSGAAALANPAASMINLPFGARPIVQTTSLSRAPPPGQTSGRFAPTASYTSSTPYGSRAPATQVSVQVPYDLKQLRLIHKTLEALLIYGPEFEALIMARPDVQRDEKWAWLWNSRSESGVYYRWRLWDIITNSSGRRKRRGGGYAMLNQGEAIFEGQSIWNAPDNPLKFEYTTHLEDFVSDEDYNSSDEEDNDGGIAVRHNDHNKTGAPPPDSLQVGNDGAGYLNPLAKTKLVHLLARLPISNARLRRGDVVRLTGFAIEHAGSGADEVAEMITMNVIKPFSATGAQGKNHESDEMDDTHDTVDQSKEAADTTSASLVGLFVVSDILSSSASAGVRHAWRYRALFENTIREQRVFERLGRMDKDLGWGKLKAEKWKRSIQSILTLWEGWCVFPQSSHDEFVQNFLNPPMSEKERVALDAEERRKAEEEIKKMKNGNNKWKTVDPRGGEVEQDVDMEDVDGQPMEDDDMIDEDIDGVPMIDSSDEEAREEVIEELQPILEETTISVEVTKAKTAPVPRQRPRAVDMFADEEDE